MTLKNLLEANQWKIVDILTTDARPAELSGVDDLALAPAARNFLARQFPKGIYRHQKQALAHALQGENVCLVTGTASGKSLVFQTAAIHLLANDPRARVMAIYPMKALGNEQQERWQAALENARLPRAGQGGEGLVGRIDGSVPPGFRLNVLERSRVVVFTPDIIHAWLFSNLNQPAVIDFLRNVRLVVVDEVHSYSGVFGSNAAFLFRRLQHVLGLLGAHPAYIGASATIARPARHLRSLFGLDFAIIGPEQDSSPRYPLDVYMVNPPGQERFLNEVVGLLGLLAGREGSRFIAFVDSRKQVELISTILNRLLKETHEAPAGEEAPAPRRGAARGRKKALAEEEETEAPDTEGEVTGVLQGLNVLPYRAGYEDHDRRQIQERLSAGTLNGVVSTSALELGIDIANLDICILIGAPSSNTSLWQRIGRIGRHGPGKVILVNGGDAHDAAAFANPRGLFQGPLAESTLYMENEHIQYIHALCLARLGGEHDQVDALRKNSADPQAGFQSAVEWPERFLELCRRERLGEAPRRLASLKMEARDRPNYTFPLRDVESQFKVERRDGPNVTSMGSLSFAQLMREAYPGAIYYYATIPYRVTRVNIKAKVVQVRREKRYTTQPQRILPAIFPRLSPGGVFSAARQGELIGLETSLLARDTIKGVIEQRGRNESQFPYPLARELGFSQDQPFFSRNYFTTGVVLAHPALAGEGVNLELAAGMLHEAFLLTFPFERQDIGFAADYFRADKAGCFTAGSPFLTIYDQTYGSLRLSNRLLQARVLGQALAEAAFLAGGPAANGSRATAAALAEMAVEAFANPRQELAFGGQSLADSHDPQRWERIVLPQSKGLMVRTNEEFHVIRILKTPVGLSYEGTPASMLGTAASVMPLLADVAEIPGESEVGWYDVESGEIEPAAALEGSELAPSGLAQPPSAPEAGWLRRALLTYLDDAQLAQLAALLGLPDDEPREQIIERLAETGDPTQAAAAALRIATGG